MVVWNRDCTAWQGRAYAVYVSIWSAARACRTRTACECAFQVFLVQVDGARLEALPLVQGDAQRDRAAGLKWHGLQEGHILEHDRQRAGGAPQPCGERLPRGRQEGSRLLG